MSSIHAEMIMWRLHLRNDRIAKNKEEPSQMPHIGEFIGE